ncbi:hypothetical protein CDAR_166651 [Caerostris darwini]|uniref:Uncharacterized protein n=1 Tax=Caerostris darwini TaxID=1538125 RepID=A0AAV4NFE5_9ARAC|nr:hypothetical protein CDAR_166651 [Caerostris darwini]
MFLRGPAGRDPREKNSTFAALPAATNFRLVGSIGERNRCFFYLSRYDFFWSAVIASHCAGKRRISDNLDGMEDDYLFIDESSRDGEDETEFDDVPEDIKNEYDELFMLSNIESS